MTSRFNRDGLLPRVDDDEFEWSRPNLRESDDPIADSVRWIGDIATQLHFVWPAFDGGIAVVPPMEHVLDTLTRQRVSGDRAEVDAELMLHCQAGTAAVVQVLPPCYVCGEAARYDGPASKEANVAWGNMCTAHYLEQSTGRLGLGEGQYLFKADEISSELLEALESAVEYWSSWTN